MNGYKTAVIPLCSPNIPFPDNYDGTFTNNLSAVNSLNK